MSKPPNFKYVVLSAALLMLPVKHAASTSKAEPRHTSERPV